MKTFLHLFIILLFPVILKSQWQQTGGPAPTIEVWGYGFKDNMVFAATALSYFVDYPYGKVYRTSNKGELWEEASSGLPLSASLYVTSFATEGSSVSFSLRRSSGPFMELMSRVISSFSINSQPFF